MEDDEVQAKSAAPTLQTVDRALMFLEFIAAQKDPPTVQAVSEALGLNITTCYHMMRTLANRDYLKRRKGGKLVLGKAIAPLYQSYRSRLDINQELAAIVGQLCEATGETSYFSAPEEDCVVLQILADGTHQLRVGGIYTGSSGREHVRASARAILPYLSEAHRKRILDASLSAKSSKDAKEIRKKFEAAMELTRERGWSSDSEAYAQGITGIGRPVFDGQGKILGALGLIVPTLRMESHYSRYMDQLAHAAHQAEEMLRNTRTN